MKKIVLVLVLNLFFSGNLVAQKDKKIELKVEFNSDELITRIDKLVLLSQEQINILKKYFYDKTAFFVNAELSDSRKEIVLLAYKREFDSYLSVKQIELLNKDKEIGDTIFNSY
jgi:hypothetical protein